MRIKESISFSLKYGTKKTYASNMKITWLERVLSGRDALGRRGIDVFKKKDVEIVGPFDKADFGLSRHGDIVPGLPKKKCILVKGEPPIYNLFFGIRLCSPHYLRKWLKVLSVYKIGLNEEHFLAPCWDFQYISEYFDKPKPKFLVMILRNKTTAVKVSNFIPFVHKYVRYSNAQLRVIMDNYFCTYLGPDLYSSYGRGWNPICFHGSVPFNPNPLENTDSRYDIIGSHKFTVAFENSCFPGYVTEKPIQAMCCGSIPIYYGAPDVEEYLPHGTFIDLRDFIVNGRVDGKGLVYYLLTMSDSEYNTYRKRIKSFITSEEADGFSSVALANKLIRIMEEAK